MKTINFRGKAFLTATLFAILVVIISWYLSNRVDQKKSIIIASNTEMVSHVLPVLQTALTPVITQIWETQLIGRYAITRAQGRSIDSVLSAAYEAALVDFSRIEGGIYFMELDDFIGYAYPGIPSPKPAFGPPPRSYDIVRNQSRTSVLTGEYQINLHGFDPAVFPLGSIPIFYGEQAIAAIWARTHIERELAATGDVATALLYMTMVVSFLGFLIALAVSWRTNTQIEAIRVGLDRIKRENTYRLPESKGVLGTISHYINDVVSALIAEQDKSRSLEKDLHQKDKMATLGNLIAGVAHEINTPVAIIKTRVQMWERTIRKQKNTMEQVPIAQISVDLVHHELNRISSLVKRLLVFSKPVDGRFEVINISHLLRNICDNLNNTLAGTVVFTNASEEVRFEGDPNALEQVIINIVRNGLEAGSANPMVIATITKNGNEILVHLDDNGSGISTEAEERVFDPFFTTKEEGTGLGLAISREIIHAHQGAITFEKRIPIGTRCTITLPVRSDNRDLLDYTQATAAV